MIDKLTNKIREKLERGERVWLFLDYDGTLADFAPTPEDIIPDAKLIDLLGQLSKIEGLRIAIISGRRLKHIQALVPVPGIILAGTYGVELTLLEQGDANLLDYAAIRPFLESVKPIWEGLISGREGFFLEDKGWALAIHAKYAVDEEAEEVLSTVRDLVCQIGIPELFRLKGGDKFLEIGPKLANKGKTVITLLEMIPWPGALLIYVGDDDKDEEAFEIINLKDGHAVIVSKVPRPTLANYRLESPKAVREWLKGFIATSHP